MTAVAPGRTSFGADAQPVTARRAVRSEWIKISTLRSTWLTLGLAMLGTVVVGGVACWNDNAHWAQMHARALMHFNAIDDSLTGVLLAQLVVAVLGVLTISGEYATGMIRSSLAAAPRRVTVLWAKLTVYASLTAVAMVVTTLTAFFVGQALLGSHSTTIGAPHAARAVFGGAAYLVAVGVIALAIGFVVRSTAGGIAAVVGLLLVLPALMDVLPASWQPHLSPYLPSNAGQSLYAVHSDVGNALSPGTALLVLVIWCLVAVVVARAALLRRDA